MKGRPIASSAACEGFLLQILIKEIEPADTDKYE